MTDRPYALIDAGGVVTGVVLWDGVRDWAPPPGFTTLAWTPDLVVPEAPPVVPFSVTNAQARAVMRAMILPDGRSLETTVDGYLRAQKQAASVLPEADPQRIAADTAWLFWEQSNEVERTGALVTSLGPAFGLDAATIDALFVAAAAVSA